ncbi:Formin-like protein 6 [Hibiscus syriacus]|uniref:Formin-like protein n=1 Tax=Hibiscus syriacus TaxID=106335 RepID=A0A6A3CHA8_HIBSY|nr:Formin-like protein 6 [Hibiscus syriacus]
MARLLRTLDEQNRIGFVVDGSRYLSMMLVFLQQCTVWCSVLWFRVGSPSVLSSLLPLPCPVLSGGIYTLSAGERYRTSRDGKLPPPPPLFPPLRFLEVPMEVSSVPETNSREENSKLEKLNEEMVETLFMVNNPNIAVKDTAQRSILPAGNPENHVLDPKKSQNIAILLRALNVTIDEVCEALMEGNSDTLGTELLESLLKMAPTEEEERRLKELNDESPSKLGPAEKFLKAVLNIPFAFKRVNPLLYIANFDSEIEYLKGSFEILQAACEELRNSRMFLKLLEAVLKAGNRMNVGTNRGDAHAFKLNTLLKLVDVKGIDGKTTLLHFVVQEIIRAEGSRLSSANQNLKVEKTQQSDFQDDVEFRKLGLQVVSGLSGELTNVKKAAAMDSDVLSIDVAKLATCISQETPTRNF